MNPNFVRYKPEITKITKANSVLVNGRIFYIVKKDEDGIASKSYCVYDYETKIKVGFFFDKSEIEEKLTRLFKKEKMWNRLDLFFDKLNKRT